MNEQSRFQKNEYLFWINILDFYQNDNFLNRYFDFSLPMWLLPNVSNSSEIIQGSLVGPISVHFRVSITYYRGLRRALKPYFGLILEFWIIFLIFLMNNSIKYLLISSRTVNCSEYEATLSYSFIVNSSESIAVQIIVQLLHWTSSVI